jgi:hypothetical protein
MKLLSRQCEYWPDVTAARGVLREIDKTWSYSADPLLGYFLGAERGWRVVTQGLIARYPKAFSRHICGRSRDGPSLPMGQRSERPVTSDRS